MTDDQLEVEQRFATVPEWLLKADVSDRAVRLYAILQRFGNTSGARMPGRAELARWLHRSVDGVDRAIKDLEQLGALRVQRSRPVRKGETGVTRAPNRYFLRTTDPAIGHVLRPSGGRKHAATPGRTRAATVAAESRPYRENNNLTTSTTSARATPSTRSFRSVVEAMPAETRTQLGDLLEVAGMCRSIRRELGKSHRPFADLHVAAAAADAIAAGHDPRQIAGALIALARDPETRAAYRLQYDGPWWETGDLELKRLRDREAGRARRAAIDACDRCDEYGWRLDVDDAVVRCDHRPADKEHTA